MGRTEEPHVLEFHPNLPEVYRRKVADPEIALNDEMIKDEAAEILRSLIVRVVFTPKANAPHGLAAELHGELAQILRLGSDRVVGDEREGDLRKEKLPPAAAGGSLLSVVAGTRNHLNLLLSVISIGPSSSRSQPELVHFRSNACFVLSTDHDLKRARKL